MTENINQNLAILDGDANFLKQFQGLLEGLGYVVPIATFNVVAASNKIARLDSQSIKAVFVGDFGPHRKDQGRLINAIHKLGRQRPSTVGFVYGPRDDIHADYSLLKNASSDEVATLLSKLSVVWKRS